MRVDEVINVDIIRLGDNGEGIARVDNMVVFVPFAPPNSNVRIRIDNITKKYAKATLIEVNSSKSTLLTPFCANFTKCGGCDLQYLSYDEQLKYKQKKVSDIIKKFASQNVKVLPTIPSKNVVAYRNKIQLQVGFVDKKVVVGFYNKDSHRIVPINRCMLCGEWQNDLIDLFLEWANKYKISVYNEQTNRGLLKNVVARFVGGKQVVTIVINGDKLDEIEIFSKMLNDRISNVALYLSFNKKKNSAILGDRMVKICDNDTPVVVDGIKCDISPYSFFQVNDDVRTKLYEGVIDAVQKQDIIIDAYSGIGILTTQLAEKGNIIFGIELVKDAVLNADNLCKINGYDRKITNICGDTALILPNLVSTIKQQDEEKFRKFIEKNTLQKYDKDKYTRLFDLTKNNNKPNTKKYAKNDGENCDTLNFDTNFVSDTNCDNLQKSINDTNFSSKTNCGNLQNSTSNDKFDSINNITVVLDPPRKGCDFSVLSAVLDSKAEQVVYISCDPITLARDLTTLCTEYKITKVQPYDMFPQSNHVETLVVLTRINR